MLGELEFFYELPVSLAENHLPHEDGCTYDRARNCDSLVANATKN